MKFSTFSASFCALFVVASASNVVSPVSKTIWYAGSTASADTLNTRVQAFSDSENVPEEVTIGLYSTKWHRVFPIAEMTVSKDALAKGVDFKFDNEKVAENGPVMVKLYKRGFMGWRHTLAKSDNFRLFKVGVQNGIPKRYKFISDIEIVEADADSVAAVFTLNQAIPVGKKLEVQLVDAATNEKVGESAELVGSKETIAGGATQIKLAKPSAPGSYLVKVYARIGMRFNTRHLLFRGAPTGPAHFLSGPISLDIVSSDASEESSTPDLLEGSSSESSQERVKPAEATLGEPLYEGYAPLYTMFSDDDEESFDTAGEHFDGQDDVANENDEIEKKPRFATPAYSYKSALLSDKQDATQDAADFEAMNKSMDDEAFLGDGYDKIIADNYEQGKAEFDEMVEQNQADKVALERAEQAAQQPYVRKTKKENKVKTGIPMATKKQLRDRVAAAQIQYEIELQQKKDAAEAKKIAAEEKKARRYSGSD